MSSIAREILCEGKVQGVFFRASTQNQAKSLQLKGWVKNKSDGSVLIHAEGKAEAIDVLIAWCKVGPEAAIVEQVKVRVTEVKGFEAFKITH